MRGHIRKRGKDSWAVVVYAGFDPTTGKERRIWQSVRGSEKDAEIVRTQLLNQLQLGIDIPSARLTTGAYLEQWLDAYAKANVATKTYVRYESLIRIHISPALGSIRLAKLRPLHIQNAYALLRDKGLSPRTILQAHRILKEALKHAVRWQLVGRNPADSVEAPKPKRSEILVLSNSEIERLMREADPTQWGALIHSAVMTGLRMGELMGLRWQDVDLEASRLYVRQTLQWLSRGEYSFQPPKTHRSARPVALSPATVERLRAHRKEQIKHRLLLGAAWADEHDLVFVSSIGTPMVPSNIRRALRQILKRARLSEHVRFHDLRHAHATLLLKEGVHPKVVSERLGHAGIAITLDTYSHVIPGLQDEAAAKLDRTLGLG
jgi:integrase